MLTTNLTSLSDADVYVHTLAILTSLSRNPKAQQSIRMLKMLSTRPIQDLDLIEASRTSLAGLRQYLVQQASPDYWYDNFMGINGEIDPNDMNSINDILEERQRQIRYVDVALARLS